MVDEPTFMGGLALIFQIRSKNNHILLRILTSN